MEVHVTDQGFKGDGSRLWQGKFKRDLLCQINTIPTAKKNPIHIRILPEKGAKPITTIKGIVTVGV